MRTGPNLSKSSPDGRKTFNSHSRAFGRGEVTTRTAATMALAVHGLLRSAFLVLLISSVICFSAPPPDNKPLVNEVPCELSLSVEIPKAFLHKNGSLWDPEGEVMYPPGTYWKWEGEGGDRKSVYKGCPCKLRNRPCIRKCCPIGESMNNKALCTRNPHPLLLNVTSDGENFFQVDGTKHFALLFGDSCAHNRYRLEPFAFPEDEFIIRANDGILVITNQNGTEQGPGNYCIDYFPREKDYLPLICFPPPNDTERGNPDQIIYTMYPIGMLFSIPFLLVTFLVYALIPELRNLHGKSLMCHVSSLLTAYTFLAVVQLGGNRLSDGICIACAFIIEFSFLATFFWLNIMCFDICLTFSGLRPLRGSLRERERKKFLIYSLYAWGCPLIMLTICIIMDYLPGIPDSYLKPRFGETKCWFKNKMDALAYFFGPIAVLVVCNVVLFTITAVKILRLKRETSMLKKGESRRHDDNEDRHRFNLYLKLLIVMGITWVTELISWAVGGPGYLWYITDIGNTLQGVFIFLIFVWKDKIRNILLKKLCPKLAARRSLDSSSWYKWKSSSRAISPSKTSISTHNTSVTSYSTTTPTTDSVRLKPLLNSPPTSPLPMP